jgi:hypothetical protein
VVLAQQLLYHFVGSRGVTCDVNVSNQSSYISVICDTAGMSSRSLKFIKIFAKPRDTFCYFVTSFACNSSSLVTHDEILRILNSL